MGLALPSLGTLLHRNHRARTLVTMGHAVETVTQVYGIAALRRSPTARLAPRPQPDTHVNKL